MDDVVRGICRILEPHPSHVILKKGYVLLKASRCQFQGGTREAGSGCHPWRFRGIHVLGWRWVKAILPSLTYLNSKFAPWRPSRPFPAFPKGWGFIWSNLWSLGASSLGFRVPGTLVSIKPYSKNLVPQLCCKESVLPSTLLKRWQVQRICGWR